MTNETRAAAQCPECLSKNTGEENKGEGYCYDCGNQWELPAAAMEAAQRRARSFVSAGAPDPGIYRGR